VWVVTVTVSPPPSNGRRRRDDVLTPRLVTLWTRVVQSYWSLHVPEYRTGLFDTWLLMSGEDPKAAMSRLIGSVSRHAMATESDWYTLTVRVLRQFDAQQRGAVAYLWPPDSYLTAEEVANGLA
jgi:hypothetical protein